MYTIQQLQAFDYLLKIIPHVEQSPLYGKKLKLVVELNNSLWYGDFVQTSNASTVVQKQISNGRVKQCSYHDGHDSGFEHSPLLKKMWDPFEEKHKEILWWINDLTILFKELSSIVQSADISNNSPFHPYLLDAKTIDGNAQLPLYNLQDEKIKLVSIILL